MKNAKQIFLGSILKKGEKYAGILLGNGDEPDRHIILLPGEAQGVNFDAAKKFAASAGGELPTKRMQSMLFANLKEEFAPNWYWSGSQLESGSAWYQGFDDGGQYWYGAYGECRARAVRSIAI